MSALDSFELRDGKKAAMLRAFRQMTPSERKMWRASMKRCRDGQPMRESMLEALVELGHTRDAARAMVKEACNGSELSWRDKLD
jgi:hypothetical protein